MDWTDSVVREPDSRRAGRAFLEGLGVPFAKVTDSIVASTKSPSVCPTCLEHVEIGQRFVVRPCFHIFHKACDDEWRRRNGSCPTCRRG